MHENEQFLIRRNLADAGCDEPFTATFLRLHREGRRRDQLRLLAHHRGRLLEHVHEEQRKIDCLDFLVYHLNQLIREESR